jgi:hypothetical protein
MTNQFSRWLRLLITFYVCISHIGCTPLAYKQADAYAKREPKYWTIEDVTFAAIRDKRYIRMCVELRHFDEEAITEVSLDINNIVEQLENENNAIISYEEGEKLKDGYQQDEETISEKKYAECNTALQKKEVELPIIYKNSNHSNIESILLDIKQETLEDPALIVIDHNDSRYLVFGFPENLYSEFSEHAFRCYAEDQKEPERYLIVPLAIFGDAFLVVGTIGTVVVCIALLPLCIIVIATVGDFEENSIYSITPYPNAYPLPPPTAKPDCD